MSDSYKESDILYREIGMKRSEERKELQLRATFLALLLLSLSLTSKGQQVGIGTNVSWWLTSTPNAELEIALSKKLTLNLSVITRGLSSRMK